MKEGRAEKRIAVLQKIVDRLQIEKQQLINENKQLQEQLDAEKNKQKENQEKQIHLEAELQKCINEYNKLIEENKKIKEKNITELNNLKQLRKKYNKKMSAFIKSIKREF